MRIFDEDGNEYEVTRFSGNESRRSGASSTVIILILALVVALFFIVSNNNISINAINSTTKVEIPSTHSRSNIGDVVREIRDEHERNQEAPPREDTGRSTGEITQDATDDIWDAIKGRHK